MTAGLIPELSVQSRGLLTIAVIGLATVTVSSAGQSTGPGRIAFTSSRDGSDQIYVMNADGSGVSALTRPPGDHDAPAFTRAGRPFAIVALFNDTRQVYVMNPDGSPPRRLTSPPGQSGTPSFSPDGSKIAFISAPGGQRPQIYLVDADGSHRKRLTHYEGGAFAPTFSPDGRSIAFEVLEAGQTQLYRMDADGSHAMKLTQTPSSKSSPAFSPDGQKIAFVCAPELPAGSLQVCVMDTDGSHVTRLTDWPGGTRIVMNANMSPHFSLDGRTIVFSSVRSGTEQIYLMNADGSGVIRLTNPPGTNFNPVFIP